jgi:hypothetical protein
MLPTFRSPCLETRLDGLNRQRVHVSLKLTPGIRSHPRSTLIVIMLGDSEPRLAKSQDPSALGLGLAPTYSCTPPLSTFIIFSNPDVVEIFEIPFRKVSLQNSFPYSNSICFKRYSVSQNTMATTWCRLRASAVARRRASGYRTALRITGVAVYGDHKN